MRSLFLSSITLLVVISCYAQQPPFYNDIQKFKQADQEAMPPKNAILLIGSSSFTLWKDVQDYFPGYTILNRGFGGSTLPDVTRYVEDIVYPYRPKQVIIYCGENDIASSDTITAQTVAQRFVTLFEAIRKEYHKVPIAFISMKPSPSRQRFLPKLQEANQLIREYLATKDRTAYIDVYSYMMHDDGTPRKALFVKDMLHMNKSGYLIWQHVMLPYFIK